MNFAFLMLMGRPYSPCIILFVLFVMSSLRGFRFSVQASLRYKRRYSTLPVFGVENPFHLYIPDLACCFPVLAFTSPVYLLLSVIIVPRYVIYKHFPLLSFLLICMNFVFLILMERPYRYHSHNHCFVIYIFDRSLVVFSHWFS